MSQGAENAIKLPSSVATLSDFRRLINEVEQVDNILVTKGIHERTGHTMNEDMVLSRQLSDLVAINELDMYAAEVRTQVLAQLRQLKSEPPVVHVTFATSAGHDELAKMADWVRQSVHPQALLTIGLQPELIGGAFIRTANKVFDLSVRSQLAKGRSIIVKELEELHGTV